MPAKSPIAPQRAAGPYTLRSTRSKITAEANHKNAQKQLDDLNAAAKAQWNTDNLDELRKKLKEMEDENERKRSEYQGQLDKIEAELKDVDQKFNQVQEKK